MREMALPNILPVEDKKTLRSSLCGKRKKWLVGFFISSITGVCAGLAGLVISALWTLGFLRAAPGLNQTGTWLAVAAFPLLIFAAHCLDKAARAERSIKAISYHKSHHGQNK